jgi:hypothetical protein
MLLIPIEYDSTLQTLIERVRLAQYQALKSFSREKVLMAWDFGKVISEKVASEKWGSNVIDNLAKDLQLAFPGITGFSSRELIYMRQFYVFHSQNSITHPLVAKLSWSNNKIILDKYKQCKISFCSLVGKNNWCRMKINILTKMIKYSSIELIITKKIMKP